MEKYFLLLLPIGVMILFIWVLAYKAKQSKKDWDTLKYLEKKACNISTKEEIEEFHKEFIEKASNIHNRFIYPRLQKIDGYVRGLYKQYQKK